MSGSENFSSTSGSRSPSEVPRRPCSRSIAAAAAARLPRTGGLPEQRFHLGEFRPELFVIDHRKPPDRTSDNTSEPELRCPCWNRGKEDRNPVHDTLRTGFETLPDRVHGFDYSAPSGTRCGVAAGAEPKQIDLNLGM